jgi:hypothetical protein
MVQEFMRVNPGTNLHFRFPQRVVAQAPDA